MEQEHIDPVCGMTVEPETAAAETVHGGKKWYFCSGHCLEKFKADPARYVGRDVGA